MELRRCLIIQSEYSPPLFLHSEITCESRASSEMEPYLLCPDGFILVPEIFGQNGVQDNGTAIGPSSKDYGTVVGRKGKSMNPRTKT
jgi:hypothetical protein